MEKVISEYNKPIKCWLNDIEESAMKQATNLANLPFTFKHVALMPDCHAGYGMPIGGVLATKGVIIPNAVGVDIGCGMCAVKTSLKRIDHNILVNIIERIKDVIPVGFNHQATPQKVPAFKWSFNSKSIVEIEFESAKYQMGTLGGGNHFIEIQSDNEGYIWMMIHSGSRNLGKKVADHYNKIAISLNEGWYSEVKKETDLAFLPIKSEEGKQYFEEMKYCADFALMNRYSMMDRIKQCFLLDMPYTKFGETINIAHNYARFEHHFGEDVIIHRKGATSARIDEIGIIPGSQGTKSYIVRGLGNPESFCSCSHGSGRCMGRKEAQRKLDLSKEIEIMESQGIIHGIKTVEDLDEAAGAYKDIDVVINNEKDLVETLVELHPLAVIKG